MLLRYKLLLLLQGGDADTNCAVAGALLGCKLGYGELSKQVPTWLTTLKHKSWLEKQLTK